LFFTLGMQTGILAQNKNCDGNDLLGAKNYYDEARKLLNKGALEKAATAFKNAKAAYNELGCTEKVAQMERNLLKVYYVSKNATAFREAFQVAKTRLQEAQTKKQQEDKGRIYYMYSRFLLDQKQLDSSIIYGNWALFALKETKSWKHYVSVCKHLALVAYYQQDFVAMEHFVDDAFEYNNQHLEKDKKNLKAIMQLYGALYYKTGNYEQALEKTTAALEVALASMSTRSDTAFVAEVYNNIGLFYIKIGDIYKAEDYWNNALLLSKKLENYNDVATIYLNLGEYFSKKNRLDKAYFYYEQANEALTKTKGIPQHRLDKSSININNGIADVSIKLGRYDIAQRALNKNQQTHQREKTKKDETLVMLGEFFFSQQAYDDSKEAYLQALNIRQQLYGTQHPLVAKSYYQLGQVAHRQYDKVRAQQRYNQAIRALFVEADTILAVSEDTEILDKRTLLDVLDALARLQRENKAIEKAFQTTKTAVKVIEKLRAGFKEEGSKLFIVQKTIPTYELSMELAMQLYQQTNNFDYLEHAFELVEKSKAMLLLDALKNEQARSFGSVPQHLLDQERLLARELVRYERELFEAKAAKNKRALSVAQKEILRIKRASEKLQNKLEKDYPKYHELKYDTKFATLRQVQQELDEKTVLLEYFIGNNNIEIFAIYNDTIWVESIPVDKHFNNTIHALRTSLTDVVMVTKETRNAYLNFAKNARSVYQKCITPVLQEKAIKRMIVIADGLLNYIPFAVLLTEKPNYSQTNFKTLPYLIKKMAINYHYSASMMLFNKSTKQRASKILGMASSYDVARFANTKKLDMSSKQQQIRASIEDLPGARQEVNYLQQTFRGDFKYKEAANEATFKRLLADNYYSVVHLAMHGVVDANQPAFSSLAFTYTADSVEDDFLHAYELNLLDIQTDLVVLSACETGFGKYERGEGVVSLGRGMMYAGAPSLVMTLWPINDKATSLLISSFYDYLSEGYAKDEAMRMAKLDYIEHAKELTAHPFFWASFINVGEEQAVQLIRKTSWWMYLIMGVVALSVLLGIRMFLKRDR